MSERFRPPAEKITAPRISLSISWGCGLQPPANADTLQNAEPNLTWMDMLFDTVGKASCWDQGPFVLKSKSGPSFQSLCAVWYMRIVPWFPRFTENFCRRIFPPTPWWTVVDRAPLTKGSRANIWDLDSHPGSVWLHFWCPKLEQILWVGLA